MPINNSSISISQQMDFIRKHGEIVSYFKGLKCSCPLLQLGTTFSDPNRANPSCTACHGLGWVWLPAEQIMGLVTGIQQQKELLQAGIATPGDLIFSPQIGSTLADYDKIQLAWSIPFEGELITRGDGQADTTYYGVLGVDACIVVNPTTGDITQYYVGTDFTFSENTITWVTGHGPVQGVVYSLKYQALIDWIVFVPPQPRRERGTDMGQRVILKRKHSVFNGV